MADTLHNSVARLKSQLMYSICIGCTAIILSLLVIVTYYLFAAGAHSISWSFFTQRTLSLSEPGAPGGMANAILGTIILLMIASFVGVPMGMLTGVYLSEYDAGSYMVKPVRFVCDVLAGVPSIVVGVLGYELLVAPAAAGFFKYIPYFNQINTFNGWAGALALAFIMIPIIARTTEEMLRLVPSSYREASIALGSTKARTIVEIVIPSAKGSIVTGVMLAVARVAGETAPLLFTAQESQYMPVSLFGHFPFISIDLTHSFPSLTETAFRFARDIDPGRQQLAKTGILVLIAMIFLLNLCVRFTTRSRR